MEITRTDILAFALVLSILLNVYESYRLTELSIDVASYATEEVRLGGSEIETDAARKLISDYEKAHPSPEIRGFLFSKRAFENIFRDENNFNAIAMYLVGEDKDNLRLIMKGTDSRNTAITTDYDNHVFIVQSLCPSDCSGW